MPAIGSGSLEEASWYARYCSLIPGKGLHRKAHDGIAVQAARMPSCAEPKRRHHSKPDPRLDPTQLPLAGHPTSSAFVCGVLSPLLKCRLGTSAANPRESPVGGEFCALGNVSAPDRRFDRVNRAPDHVEGSRGIYLADHSRFRQMVISVHHNLKAARCFNSLTVHRLPDGVYVGCAGLSHGLRPHPEADEGGFHRIIRGLVPLLVEVSPHFHESSFSADLTDWK